MTAHILLMNVAAPVLAFWVRRIVAYPVASGRHLTVATVSQVAILWFCHAPGVLDGAHGAAAHIAMQGALLAAALWFWLAVLSQFGAARWRSLFALLVTGKLYCLLGALLVFAPRPLHDLAAHAGASVATADQQLAGLLMLAACPATYVLAGIVISARWIAELALADAAPK